MSRLLGSGTKCCNFRVKVWSARCVIKGLDAVPAVFSSMLLSRLQYWMLHLNSVDTLQLTMRRYVMQSPNSDQNNTNLIECASKLSSIALI
jgi:hypothetical protein